MSIIKFAKSFLKIKLRERRSRRKKYRDAKSRIKQAEAKRKQKAKDKKNGKLSEPEKKKRRKRVPISTKEAEDITKKIDDLSVKVDTLSTKVGNVGESVKSIHENTVPAIGWPLSLLFGFLLVYPLQKAILDTATDYKSSAWMSGFIINAKERTSHFAMSFGIENVGGSVAYSKPLARKLIVTSHFNPRRKHPVTGKISKHNGTDYRCKIGDSVHAMRAGIIKFAKENGNAGNMIIIEHSNLEKSIYMHLDTIGVRLYEKVSTGEKIGTCGMTGRVTGPHLHVEIRKPNKKAVDPIKYVGISENLEMFDYFKNTVAQSESMGHGEYKAVSKSGSYYGRYQMGRAALMSTGYGHISWKAFLADPKLQDKIYKKWQAQNLAAGRHGIHFTTKKGVEIDINGFITNKTPAFKVAGFLHASQFGALNALRWYVEGKEFADGNATLISEYARRGENAFKIKYGRFATAMPLLRAIEDY